MLSASTVGVGGGGTMYGVAISSADPNIMVVACDMGGLYLSRDAGQHWTLLDQRGIQEPAIASDGGQLWQQNLAQLASFDIYSPAALYTIGPNRPLGVVDLAANAWTPVPVTADPAHPELLRGAAPSGPTIRGVRRLFVTDALHEGPGPSPRPAILAGLRGTPLRPGGPPLAAAVVRRDGTVTVVQERRADGTLAPIEGRCMAITACFDPGLEWAVPLLATETALYSGTDRMDATTFRQVGSGLPPLDPHLKLFDLTCAWYSERHLYATLVSDNGNAEAGVYTTTNAQGDGWTKVTGLPTDAAYGPIAAGGVIQYVGNDRASQQASRTVFVAAWKPGPPYLRVYRSRDAGAAWTHVLNVGKAADNPGGAAQNLSAGGGWVDQSPFGPDFGGAGRGLAASASVPSSVVFTNMAALHVSTDDGEHWRQGYTSPEGPTGHNRSVGLEVTTAWNYYIFPGPGGATRHAICYADIVAAIGDVSGDGQVDWRSIRPTARSGRPYNTIYELAIARDAASAGHLWAAAALSHDLPYSPVGDPEGGVLYSADHGGQWADSSTGLPTTAPAVSVVLDPAALDPTDPVHSRRLWVAMYGAGVWRSTDSGGTWQPSGLAGKHVYQLHLHADGRLFCGVSPTAYEAAGELWVSQDAGSNWTQIPLVLPYANPSQPNVTASTLLRDFAVHPTNSKILFVCTAGSWLPQQRNGGVWKSIDRGANWTHVTALDNAGPQSPGVIPPYDPDFIRAFAAFFHPSDPLTVLVTTTAHGVWHSSTAGAATSATGSDWRPLAVIPFLACQRVAFDTASASMFITTFGGGVWRFASTDEAGGPAWRGRRLRLQTPYLRGDDVRVWQRAMTIAGLKVTVDGIYGPQSQQACRTRQRQLGLVPDGVVGPATWRATASVARSVSD